jgi:uncharacterized protein YdeI (YjbR/CyaY-like superfamily)
LKCATHRPTAADGKKAAEVGRFYLGVSGKPPKLWTRSCSANNQEANKPLQRELPRFSPRGSTGSRKGDAMTTKKKPELPIIPFASPKAWETWLEEQHTTSDGLWLKIAKKGSGIETVSYAEALEAALCYGWIDGQKASFDDRYWLQRFTPRKPRSKWSKINRQKATELIERGEMKPAGLREVERAKADGRWDAAYDAQSTATVPDDLRRELEKNEVARVFFSKLDSANRYAILYQIQDAKRPETRARRIAKYVAMLSEQKKIYP